MSGAIGLISIWFIFDRQRMSPPLVPSNPIFVVLIGSIWGMNMAIGVIEAQIVAVAIPIILFLAALWIWYWIRSKQSPADFVVQRPFTGFVAMLILISLTFFLVWGLLNGGFPQPSELGL